MAALRITLDLPEVPMIDWRDVGFEVGLVAPVDSRLSLLSGMVNELYASVPKGRTEVLPLLIRDEPTCSGDVVLPELRLCGLLDPALG